ncbi:MAG TPA: hypothetical protein VFH34_05070, partial [Anaerolineales bacterium]|nr:hypothetical protein [Anaerolineales bacterium]
GTKALYLLQSYVLSHTLLKKLVIITSRDNLRHNLLLGNVDFNMSVLPEKTRSMARSLSGMCLLIHVN